MLVKIIVFRIIFFIIFTIILNSCASSSYSEKYGSNTSTNKVHEKEISTSKEVEDDIFESSRVNNDEVNDIFKKLENVIGRNKKKEKFLRELLGYLNTPYLYGGNSKKGIDCSAFTQNVYKNSLNIFIPRTAREQYKQWEPFNSRDKLKFGDLVYFDTSRKYFPGHVGIYLDNDLFAHASSSKGVIVSSLQNNYFTNRFIGANRIKIKIQK